MSSVMGGQQDVDIDLQQIGRAVWKRRSRILLATVAAAVLAFAATTMIKPSYKAETRLLIESRSPNLAAGDAAAAANDPVLDSLNITSQAQLLQSTDLIRRVARELKLAQLKEFDPAAKSMLRDPLVMIGLKPDPMKLDPEDRVVQEFRSKLNVYPVENSRVIAIEFSSHDPKLASDIPNKMAQIYLQIQSGAKQDTHSETAKWLEPEIASLTGKVREAEKKIADYRTSNGLFQTGEAGTFSGKQLNDISTELSRVRADRANAEAKAENVRNALKTGRDIGSLADVVGSQVIQRLKEAQSNLQAQINDLSTSLMEGHPRLKGLRAQLVGIRQQIDIETKNVLASLDNDATVARLREQQLTQQMNGVKADSARAGEEEVGLRALEREAAAQRQLLETYLAKYREASSRLDSNASPADARIVSNAVEPSESYFPKVIPIVVVVTLLTLIVSSLMIVIIELFSGRALRPLDPSRRVRDDEPAFVPASAPAAATPRALVRQAGLAVHRMQAEAERFRTEDAAEAALEAEPATDQVTVAGAASGTAVATPVAAQHKEDPSFSIASVARYLQRRDIRIAIAMSPGGDSGSAATVMLARDMSRQGGSTVLLDMTASACPTRLMAQDARLPGITDLLCGEAAFGEAIHCDRLSDAHIVPQGASDPVRAMRGADRLTMIIDALADAYDAVLIECGAAEIASLSRLTRQDAAEIILSVPGASEEEIARLVLDFESAGYANLLVMTGRAGEAVEPGDQQAA